MSLVSEHCHCSWVIVFIDFEIIDLGKYEVVLAGSDLPKESESPSDEGASVFDEAT